MTDERISDVQGLLDALTAQRDGMITWDGPFRLFLPPSYPVDDKVTLEKNFPNIDVITVAQYIEPERKGLAPTGQRKEDERKAKAREIVAKLREKKKDIEA